jgi:hypothetical protein
VTSFGTGMLYMMADADLAEGPAEPAVAWLAEIAAVGLSRRFRETVGGRVVEFTYDDGAVTVRWLSDAEAARSWRPAATGATRCGTGRRRCA